LLVPRHIGLVAVLAAFVLAQAPPAAPQDELPLYRLDAKLVLLHTSVVDKNGKLITNIPQSAFKIFEDGVEQPIRLFRREDVPVSMGIIVDNSGSMGSKRARVAAAALDLVKQSNPEDEVFIVNFNDDTHIDQTLTNDVKALHAALARMQARGGTAMRDALSQSIDYVKKNGKKDKKVLVVVTDGNDNSSNISIEQLLRKSQNSDVLIYAIGLLNEEEAREARAAKKVLRALAEASGGQDYYPKSLSDVEEITPRVAHEIRNQYILGYTSSNQALDGTFRQVKVTVAGFGHPTVRTRNGYYATPTAQITSPREVLARSTRAARAR
jgi:Ca-activated chloride channel homolog